MRLVPFTDGSTDEIKSFRTAPHTTARFGDFQVFVLRPDRVSKMRRVFTHGNNPSTASTGCRTARTLDRRAERGC